MILAALVFAAALAAPPPGSAHLSGLQLANITVPPGQHSRPDKIRTLAEVHAVVLVASKRCANLFASEEVDGLQSAFGLSNGDSAEAYSQLVSMAREMNAKATEIGEEAWCNEAYERFGPKGTMMTGLLKRCDPKSPAC